MLSFPHALLIKNGILVQVKFFKANKKLPMKDSEVKVSKGTNATFFKVGPDVHMKYQGQFYHPDIDPEHLEIVFKNFEPMQIHNSEYPSIVNLQPFEKNFYNATSVSRNMDPRDVAKFR